MDAESEQIPDLQTCDRGHRNERYGAWRLGTRNAKTSSHPKRYQGGRDQNEYSEALSKSRPNQKHENGKQHLE